MSVVGNEGRTGVIPIARGITVGEAGGDEQREIGLSIERWLRTRKADPGSTIATGKRPKFA